MSSKHAVARMNREFFIRLLRLIDSANGATSFAVPNSFPRAKDKLRYMEDKGYVRRFGSSYVCTSKGKKLLTEDDIWNLKIHTPTHWDKKWHLVLFDIPTDKRKRRDIFRLRLKELGLVLYQNSVWIYPYPTKEVVQKVSDFYMLTKCVSFIVADSLSGEAKLHSHFKLQ